MIDAYKSLFLILLNFTTVSVLTTSMKFSALLTIMEQPRAVVTKNRNYLFVNRNYECKVYRK